MKQISDDKINEIINLINCRRLLAAKEMLRNLRDIKIKDDILGVIDEGCGQQDVKLIDVGEEGDIWLKCGDWNDGLNSCSGRVLCQRCKELKARIKGK